MDVDKCVDFESLVKEKEITMDFESGDLDVLPSKTALDASPKSSELKDVDQHCTSTQSSMASSQRSCTSDTSHTTQSSLSSHSKLTSSSIHDEQSNTSFSQTSLTSFSNIERVNTPISEISSQSSVCSQNSVGNIRAAKSANNSEDENDVTLKNIEQTKLDEQNSDDLVCNKANHAKKHKRLALIDSDSDDEEASNRADVDEGSNENEIKKHSKPFIDTDSEDENKITTDTFYNKTGLNVSKKSKAPKLIDTDSEDGDIDEEEVTLHNKSFEKQNATPVIYNTNEKGELIPETYEHTSRLNALCDSESSEDEHADEINDHEDIAPVPYKKKTLKKTAAEKPKKMTTKEAKEQRREIESESQRMLREKHVSLPYHKPKQRTLKEFLKNRPRFASVLPADLAKTPPSIAIKKAMNHLELITKNIEEREKVMSQFFKSDSEDSDCENNANTRDENEKSENQDEMVDEVKESSEVVEKNDVEPEANVDNLNQKENSTETVDKSNAKNVDSCEEEANPEAKMEIEVSLKNLTEEKPENKTPEEKPENKTAEEKVSNENEDTNIEDSFEFDLDGLEECGEDGKLETPTDNAEEAKQDLAEPSETSKRLKLLKEQFANTKPRLSGGPNLVIDLDEGVTKPSEVTQLMDRFIKHACKKTHPHHKSKVELSVMCVSKNGEIHKEKLAVNVDDSEAPPINEKPGVKMQQLRRELQNQMTKQRTKLWEEKRNLLKKTELNEEEKSVCGEDKLLDDEEEEFSDYVTDEEEEIEEDEEESCTNEAENKRKNELIEDEAGESEMEDDEEMEEGDADEGDEEEKDEEQENVNEKVEQGNKKKLKRIIKAFDDSDEEIEDTTEVLQGVLEEIKLKESNELDNEKAMINKSLNSTESWDDEFLPPGQKNDKTPKRMISQQQSELGFLSPVSHLTGLQSFEMTSTFLHSSRRSPKSVVLPAEDISPLKSDNWQKELFTSEVTNTQEELDEIADLCTGKFPETQPESSKISQVVPNAQSSSIEQQSYDLEMPPPSTQDLLDICSGGFTGFTKKTKISVPHTQTHDSTAKLNSDSVEEKLDEDRMFSQILDENEMEEFKKKFMSPINSTEGNNRATSSSLATRIMFGEENENTDIIKKNVERDLRTDTKDEKGSNICENNADIDDEDEEDVIVRHKRKQKVIEDSDEEDEVVDNDSIDLHDEDELENYDEPQEVDYDSEENEIVIDKSAPVEKLKVADFVENEAELSESEWGSEDEDEQGMDELEKDMLDDKKIDESQVRSDLEKIHLRRVLDDDTREVKILQELLLEDGELHGAGRQKQFRWKNLNNENGDEEQPQQEDDENPADEEDDNEEEWRKKRFERELFLKKQTQKSLDEDLDITLSMSSQVMKMGQKAIIRNTTQNTTLSSEKPKGVTDVKQSFLLYNKRGSFLTRGDQVLARVAEYTKVNDAVIGGAKNSRNFVFQSVNESVSVAMDKKRKAASDGTPMAIKKIRLNNFSPANQSKTEKNLKSSKKLFSNW